MSKMSYLTQKGSLSDVTFLYENTVQISEHNRHYEPVLGSSLGARTYLATLDRSFYTPSTPSNKILKYRRLDVLNKRKSTLEKKENSIIMLIRRVSSNLNIPKSARERAISLFLKCARKIAQSNKRELVLLAAACLLIAVRELKHAAPITLQEIVSAFNQNGVKVNPMKTLWTIKNIEQLLGNRIPLRSCKDYVWRLTQEAIKNPIVQKKLRELGIDPEIYKHRLALLAIMLLNKVEERKGGRRPLITALASIYAADRILAFRENHKPILTQRIIARIGAIAESTLREHYASLFKDIVIKETYLTMLRYVKGRSS